MSPRIAALLGDSDPALIDRLEALISETVALLDEGKSVTTIVAEINALSGMDYKPDDFFELYSHTGERDEAERAAKGMPPALADLTRDELIEIISVIETAQEPASTFLLELLNRALPGAWSSDLIFYPHREMSTEETVDELLLRVHLFQSGGASAVQTHERALARAVLADPASPPWALQWAQSVPGART